MRSVIETSAKGLQVRAIAGTYVVILAFNCPPSYCSELLGFGIRREDQENGEIAWLRGMKRFDLPASDAGGNASTRQHPIQKFHWGDYTTKPGRTYTYTVHAFKGKPSALTSFESVSVRVRCEMPDAVGDNGHAVHFNRSAAASQAFARRFPDLPAGEIEDANARTWLSRGLEEALIAFIDQAKPRQGLHVFVYEFEKDAFFLALKRAKARKVRLQIVYDGMLDNSKGPAVDAEPKIAKYGLKSVCKARSGAGLNISHNKFIVLTNTSGKPTAVWTGSTNFTDSAIYGQSNVGHAIRDGKLAQQYFDWHQIIWQTPTLPGAGSRKIAMRLSPLPATLSAGTHLVLSPRQTTEAIDACSQAVTASKRLICFTAPFALHDDLEAALVTTPAHVLGLLNTAGVVQKALHQAPNTQLASSAAIDDKSILERWQGRLLAESRHHSGVHIHTKILLVDPLSDQPLVVTGSANFSTNACKFNDENQLFIIGDQAVADVYFGEFLRLFDHYYFRDHMAWAAKQKKLNPKAGFLDGTDQWTARFFDGGEREAVRLAFFS